MGRYLACWGVRNTNPPMRTTLSGKKLARPRTKVIYSIPRLLGAPCEPVNSQSNACRALNPLDIRQALPDAPQTVRLPIILGPLQMLGRSHGMTSSAKEVVV